MKWILLFLCLPAFGQLPILPFAAPNTTPSFKPTDIAGLKMWLSITNGLTNNAGSTTISDGNTIKGWADLSGNGNFVCSLGTTTLQPIYKSTTGPSGGPALGFTNAMSLTNVLGGATAAQPNTFIYVMKCDIIAVNGGILNGSGDQNQQINTPGNWTMTAGSVVTSQNTDVTAGTVYKVYSFIFNGASSQIYTNAVIMAPPWTSGTTVGTGGLKGITLGNYFNHTIAAREVMTEFLWYNAALNSTQISQITTYERGVYGF